MKADLLTYPLPFEGNLRRFGLKQLADLGIISGMDLIGIIGVTDTYDIPDHRWRDFWEGRKELGRGYETFPFAWNSDKKILTAFSVSDKEGRKVTFLYGSNNPVNYRGEKTTALCIGFDDFERAVGKLEDLEFVLGKAEKNGNLVLASPETFLLFKDKYKHKFDGMYWRAESRLGRKNKQENTFNEAEYKGFSIVPVSNAHSPYLRPFFWKPSEIGRAYIEFDNLSWDNGEELVRQLKEIIRGKRYEEHRESTPMSRFLLVYGTMALRKLPRKAGISWFDYEWSGKEPVVKID